MVEECFEEPSADDNGQRKDDKSVQIVRPWFKQAHLQLPRSEGQWAEHVPAKAVLQRLVGGRDDLPACLIFYPVNNQPHSIQETWLAGKGES